MRKSNLITPLEYEPFICDKYAIKCMKTKDGTQKIVNQIADIFEKQLHKVKLIVIWR